MRCSGVGSSPLVSTFSPLIPMSCFLFKFPKQILSDPVTFSSSQVSRLDVVLSVLPLHTLTTLFHYSFSSETTSLQISNQGFLNLLILKLMGFKSSKQSGCTTFLLSFWSCKQRIQGVFWSILGFMVISVIFLSFKVIWSFFFCHRGILVIFNVSILFWSFFRFYGNLGLFLVLGPFGQFLLFGFKGNLVIFQALSLFQSYFW